MPGRTRLSRRRTLRLVLGGGLASPFVARPAHAAIGWTMFCHLHNETTATFRGLRMMADRVRDATSGGLLIRVRGPGQLPIDANNVLQATSSGQVEMGDDGNYLSTIPRAAVLRLPMLMTTPKEFESAAGVLRPMLETEMTSRGLILLGHYRSALQTIWSRRPTTRLADVGRQRLRVLSVEQSEFVRNYNGLHLMMSNTEMGEALRDGRADGALTTAFQGGRTWKQYLKHVYLVGPNYTDALITVSRAAMERIPEDMRRVVRIVAAEAAAWISVTQDIEETQMMRGLAGEGLTVTQPVPGEVEEAIQKLTPFWDSWVRMRGRDTESLLAQVRQVLDR